MKNHSTYAKNHGDGFGKININSPLNKKSREKVIKGIKIKDLLKLESINKDEMPSLIKNYPVEKIHVSNFLYKDIEEKFNVNLVESNFAKKISNLNSISKKISFFQEDLNNEEKNDIIFSFFALERARNLENLVMLYRDIEFYCLGKIRNKDFRRDFFMFNNFKKEDKERLQKDLYEIKSLYNKNKEISSEIVINIFNYSYPSYWKSKVNDFKSRDWFVFSHPKNFEMQLGNSTVIDLSISSKDIILSGIKTKYKNDDFLKYIQSSILIKIDKDIYAIGIKKIKDYKTLKYKKEIHRNYLKINADFFYIILIMHNIAFSYDYILCGDGTYKDFLIKMLINTSKEAIKIIKLNYNILNILNKKAS